jgi:hypothetical protein
MNDQLENDAAEKARIAAEAEEIQRFIDAKPNVGYGNPPIDRRFKKGASGNPRGRPPKSERAFSIRQIYADIIQAGEVELDINIGAKRERLPAFMVGLRKLNLMAAQGDLKAIRMSIDVRREALKHNAVANKRLHDVLEDMEKEALANGHLSPNHDFFKQLNRWRMRTRRF